MDNYYVTAQRMYSDLEVLYKENRWFNTCYLSGYVVECYSKLILSQILGMTQTQVRNFRHDLQRINIELQTILPTLISGGRIPSSFLVDINCLCPNICSGSQSWHPEHRYSDGVGFWEETIAKDYYTEVNKLILILIEMDISGVIR